MPTSKTQFVRLLDVFVFGPLMVAAGRSHSSAYFSSALMLIGIGTIVYNGVNYLQNQDSVAPSDSSLSDASLGCACQRPPKRPHY